MKIKFHVIFTDTTNNKCCRLGLLSAENARAACFNVNAAFGGEAGARILHASVITQEELDTYKLVATEECRTHQNKQVIG